MDLRELYLDIEKYLDKEIVLQGWIRNHRKQKEFGFIDFSDGTCFKHIQLVYDNKLSDFEEIQKFHIGSAITVKGTLIKSQGSGQDYEVSVKAIKLEGDCPEDYPMQPKRHTNEFLRSLAYLRPRTNLFQAVFRVRSVAAYAIHSYFQDKGFVYFHAPLFTTSDCEGAGEMFQVTTLDLDRIAKEGKVDYSKDFFGKKANLTVSGQLEAETFALAYKKTYTFGPTFRAENSNTNRHTTEFTSFDVEFSYINGYEDVMNLEAEMHIVTFQLLNS